MILVDSSVWIDYLRGTQAPHTDRLDELLARQPLAIGDLMLAEVLQGCRSEREAERVQAELMQLELVVIGGVQVSVETARNFRRLRALGVTVRKTIDGLIATRCLLDGFELLHHDRDFDAFERHLGLRCVR